MPTRPPKHRPLDWKPQEVYERQRKAVIDQQRPSAAERGYDKAWFRLRHHFVRANPTCCVAGCGAPTEHVDHVQSIRDRPDLRLVWSNLRPMCAAHHNARTAREQGFARGRRQGGV